MALFQCFYRFRKYRLPHKHVHCSPTCVAYQWLLAACTGPTTMLTAAAVTIVGQVLQPFPLLRLACRTCSHSNSPCSQAQNRCAVCVVALPSTLQKHPVDDLGLVLMANACPVVLCCAGKLPLMEIVFLLEREERQNEQSKSIHFKSMYGMPIKGRHTHLEPPWPVLQLHMAGLLLHTSLSYCTVSALRINLGFADKLL